MSRRDGTPVQGGRYEMRNGEPTRVKTSGKRRPAKAAQPTTAPKPTTDKKGGDTP